MKCGSKLKIINDTTVSSDDCVAGCGVNAYSMDKADIALKDKCKFVWKIKITDLPSNGTRFHSDLRIGIASTFNHLETFTNAKEGHNYAYISYSWTGYRTSHIGYNAKWTSLSAKNANYWTNDIITVELNLRDREISYFKNAEFIAKQENIVQTTYRLGVNIMSKSGKMEIISFQFKQFDKQ